MYFFREPVRKREREGEKNINQLPPEHALTRDQICNLCMCSDWESKRQPMISQPTEPRQPVHFKNFFKCTLRVHLKTVSYWTVAITI